MLTRIKTLFFSRSARKKMKNLVSVKRLPALFAFLLALGALAIRAARKALMAAGLISIIPVLIIFLVGQKYFVEDVSAAGIKG